MIGFLFALLIAQSPSSYPTPSPSPIPIQTTFNGDGLKTLFYNGVKLADVTSWWANGFRLRSYQLMKDGKPEFHWASDAFVKTEFNLATKTHTQTYKWGTVTMKYLVQGDRLKLQFIVTNLGDMPLGGVDIFPLSFRVPSLPEKFLKSSGAHRAFSTVPSIIPADFGKGTIILTNEDLFKQLATEITANDIDGSTEKMVHLRVASYADATFDGMNPIFSRIVLPSKTDTFSLVIRFTPKSNLKLSELAPDLLTKFRIVHPYKVNWPDRRPIGTHALAVSVKGHPEYFRPKNPNGYFWFDLPEDYNKVDVTTEEGLKAFKKRLVEYSKRSVEVLKMMNAQGSITWDLEGEGYRHPVSYVGDPRMIPFVAPELDYDHAVDEYFKIQTDAGLRCGMTVRTTKMITDGIGDQVRVEDPIGNVIAKIKYAKRRWGCTLFYFDSNPHPDDMVEGAHALERIMKEVPGVLVFPEQESAASFAYGAPWRPVTENYADERCDAYTFWSCDVQGTHVPVARELYPEAFGALVINASLPSTKQRSIDHVKAGGIIFTIAYYPTYAWWHPENWVTFTNEIMKEGTK